MAGTTPKGFRFPQDSDAPNIAVDIENLATDVDTELDDYLTTATAASTYLTAGSAASTYLTIATATADFAPKVLSTTAATASYVLVLTDAYKIIEIDSASANEVTIPVSTSVDFPVGTQITVIQTGAGQTTLAGTAGVTVNAKDGNLKIAGQWASATLIKRATDAWVAIGNLVA
jgi:hypothetical protein